MANLIPENKPRFDASQQFGFQYALEHYLTYNPQDTRSAYIISAQIQADLLTIPANGTVVELAGGTGNSGLAFLESFPTPIDHLVTLDRSNNTIIAGRRFNQVDQLTWERLLADIPAISQAVLANIEDSRQRRQELETKTLVVQARSQDIPLPSNFADGMFCVQGFHWFLFADTDVAGNDPNYIATALAEMRRVLKPGAELVFDTHGGAVDFGDLQMDGQLLNDLHFNRHPIHLAFVAALNEELRAAGYQTQIIPERPNKYHQQLTEPFMLDQLTKAGLEPVYLTDQSMYYVEPIKMDMRQFLQTRKHAGQMVYFTDPEVSGLSDDEKAQLLSNAVDRLSMQNLEPLFAIPAYEFLVFFKARAR